MIMQTQTSKLYKTTPKNSNTYTSKLTPKHCAYKLKLKPTSNKTYKEPHEKLTQTITVKNYGNIQFNTPPAKQSL